MGTPSWDEYVHMRSRRGTTRLGLVLLLILLVLAAVDYAAIVVLVAVGTLELDAQGIVTLTVMPLVLAALFLLARRTWRKYSDARDMMEKIHGSNGLSADYAGPYAEERKKIGIRRLAYGISSWLLLLAFIYAGALTILGIVIVASEGRGEDGVRGSFYVVLSAMFLLAVLLFVGVVKVSRAYKRTRDTAWKIDAGIWMPGEAVPSGRGVAVLGTVIALLLFASCFTAYYFYNPARLLRETTEAIYKPVMFNLEPLVPRLSPHDFSEGLAAFELDGKYGYVNGYGNVVIEPSFYSAGPFSEGMAVVELNAGYGYIDRTGRVMIETPFNEAASFSEGLAKVRGRGGFGFIDETGEVVIEPRFELAGSFHEGLACVAVNGDYGYIDKSGAFAIEPVFWTAFSFSDGTACVQYDTNDYGEIIEKYGQSGNSQVLMEVTDNIVTGYIDTTGKPVIWPRFRWAWPFNEGFARVNVNGEEWFIDSSGKKAFRAEIRGFDPGSYPFVDHFVRGGMVLVYHDGSYGFMDTNGDLVIPPSFEDAGRFSEGLAPVSVERKWGYIKMDGAVVIAPQLDFAGDFHEGLAYVEAGDRSGYIDYSGTMVIVLPSGPGAAP